uniref:Uncharacterized protein n=1 Tax=Arundo donax TaxID=35708 RepID=A0A0A9TZ20_ARUDO
MFRLLQRSNLFSVTPQKHFFPFSELCVKFFIYSFS